jgi:septum formation protein
MIYLASTSPRRKSLLREAGIRYRVVPTAYDEKPIKGLGVAGLVRRHALEKGLSALPNVKSGTILSADTVVYFAGKIIGKPRSMGDAERTLGRLQGRWHAVYTGVALLEVKKGKVVRKKVYVERTRIFLKAMDALAIRAYFKTVNPLDKAGSYAIQSRRRTVVEKSSGSFTNAVGLPMESLARHLTAISSN